MQKVLHCRTLDWIGCCCSGAEAPGNDHLGASSSTRYLESSTGCPDVRGFHPATHICSLLAAMPSSVSLDSGYLLKTFTLLLKRLDHLIYINLVIFCIFKTIYHSNITEEASSCDYYRYERHPIDGVATKTPELHEAILFIALI